MERAAPDRGTDSVMMHETTETEPMNSAPVVCEISEGVATVTLNNPPVNAMTIGLTAALGDVLDALHRDPAVRAVVLTGAGGKAFCAGSDIHEFHALMAPGRVVPGKLRRQNEVFFQLDRFAKPTVAAVSGLAYGGGLEIAVCCDLIVADDSARFALPEIRLGVFPSSGGPMRVTRRIGEGRAKEMMLLGEPVDAATALAWGLVNRVVPAGGALAAARQMAAKLARQAPQAMDLCKQAIGLAFDYSLDAAMAKSFALSDRAFSSAECREGVRAFFAKETPRFGAPESKGD